MARKNRKPLKERVSEAAEAALAIQGYVSPIDVLLRLGWLNSGQLESWRRGQTDSLEQVIQIDPTRISEALALLQSWATAKGLLGRETQYVGRQAGRPALRFSESGDPILEQRYRTHWFSDKLSERSRQRLAEKVDRAPELVVVAPLNRNWRCNRCGGTGDLLMMENPGPACLHCVGLDDLEFLPAGDAQLTRRAKQKSGRYAVVVKFSLSRRRYERQGLLVEAQALSGIEQDLQPR